MNLRKYRFIKIIALLMAFVWLFGSYATGMTGVHATDDYNGYDAEYYYDDTGENYSGENSGETDEETHNIEGRSVWPPSINPPRIERRDHIVETPRERNDNLFYDGDVPVRRPPFTVTQLPNTPLMSFDAIFNHFFNCQIRRGTHPTISGDEVSSGHFSHAGTRHPLCPYERHEAFRIWHFQAGVYNYLEMVAGDTLSTLGSRWGLGGFQYAYVQYLHFNTNFERDGVQDDVLGPSYRRAVIMGSHYDRMFVQAFPDDIEGNIGDNTAYQTLRNYLFPTSPTCISRPHPIPGIQPSHNNLVHPRGYIFGGWFKAGPADDLAYHANNLGTQYGRVLERGTGSVTAHANRTIYARWYPLPTVEKTVTPGQLTQQQVADGATLAYTITVNTGNLPANMINLVVEDILDERLSLVANSVAISPLPGSYPRFTLADDGTLRFYISEFSGSDPIPNGRVVINFRATVNEDAIPEGTTTDVVIDNIAYLWGPPGTGPICPYDGYELPIDTSPPARVVITPPIPPERQPDCECECDCPECDCECDCPECDCECDCVECDCEPPTRRQETRKQGGAGRGAPRTGDLLSVTPFLSSILFSMSAIFGGAALRRRFKK